MVGVIAHLDQFSGIHPNTTLSTRLVYHDKSETFKEKAMTGRELRDALNALPEADLDLPVELYANEEGGTAHRIEVLTADDEPYYKGDGPWKPFGHYPIEQRLIFVRGRY